MLCNLYYIYQNNNLGVRERHIETEVRIHIRPCSTVP
jgi:hypothetical protein